MTDTHSLKPDFSFNGVVFAAFLMGMFELGAIVAFNLLSIGGGATVHLMWIAPTVAVALLFVHLERKPLEVALGVALEKPAALLFFYFADDVRWPPTAADLAILTGAVCVPAALAFAIAAVGEMVAQRRIVS